LIKCYHLDIFICKEEGITAIKIRKMISLISAAVRIGIGAGAAVIAVLSLFGEKKPTKK
jgi:hypothetical protein